MSLRFVVSNLRCIQRQLRMEELNLENLRTCLDSTIDEIINLTEAVEQDKDS